MDLKCHMAWLRWKLLLSMVWMLCIDKGSSLNLDLMISHKCAVITIMLMSIYVYMYVCMSFSDKIVRGHDLFMLMFICIHVSMYVILWECRQRSCLWRKYFFCRWMEWIGSWSYEEWSGKTISDTSMWYFLMYIMYSLYCDMFLCFFVFYICICVVLYTRCRCIFCVVYCMWVYVHNVHYAYVYVAKEKALSVFQVSQSIHYVYGKEKGKI